MPVAAAQSLGQLPHLVTAAVVEHPDSGVGIALLRQPRSDRCSTANGSPQVGTRTSTWGLQFEACQSRWRVWTSTRRSGKRRQASHSGSRPVISNQLSASSNRPLRPVDRAVEIEAGGAAPVQIAQGQGADQQDQAASGPERRLRFRSLDQRQRPEQQQQAHSRARRWFSSNARASCGVGARIRAWRNCGAPGKPVQVQPMCFLAISSPWSPRASTRASSCSRARATGAAGPGVAGTGRPLSAASICPTSQGRPWFRDRP